MSRSYTRNLNTVSLITLCPVCLHSFQDAKRATLRRADLRQRTKDVCDQGCLYLLPDPLWV